MFPVPRLARQIELEWAKELADYFGRSTKEVEEKVRPWLNFPSGRIRILLMDGSVLEFECSIFIVSEAKKTIAVFTEHCGNHVFPFHEATIFRDGEKVYG